VRGDTVSDAPFDSSLQEYVEPPDAVKVVLPPAQTDDKPLIETTGRDLTNNARDLRAVQPFSLVTVTAYTVFTVGATVIDPIVEPVLHAYVPPPSPVRTTLDPLQTVAGPAMLGEGNGLIISVLETEDVHPELLVTVTV
jgi:hypothetical protein